MTDLQTVDQPNQADSVVTRELLSDDEQTQILGLSTRGWPIQRIAKTLDRRWHTVRDFLERAGARTSTVEMARSLAQSDSYDRVQQLKRWTKKRDKVGLDAIKHLDAIAGVVEEERAQVNVAVVLGVSLQPPIAQALTVNEERT